MIQDWLGLCEKIYAPIWIFTELPRAIFHLSLRIGGAAKPQDETKVFICGSAVFEGEAVCLGLEGSGVGERERMGFRQSPAAQWLLGEAAPPFTARRPRGLSHPPSNFDSTVDAAPENGVTKQKLLL